MADTKPATATQEAPATATQEAPAVDKPAAPPENGSQKPPRGKPKPEAAAAAPGSTESTAEPKPEAASGKKGKKPKPLPDNPGGGVKANVPAKDITVDPMFQMRKELFNPPTVARYGEMMKDGFWDWDRSEGDTEYSRIYLMDTGTRLILFSGFNRFHAAVGEIAKMKEIPALIFKGSDRDAKFWAVRQNPDRGLPRNQQDIRRAINALLDDAEMLKEVLDKSKEWTGTEKGGAHRGVAYFLNVSTGALQRALDEREESLTGAGLRAKPKSKPEAAPAPAAPGAAPTAEAGVTPTPQELDAARMRESLAKETRDVVVVNAIAKQVARVQIFTENLLERKDAAPIIRKHLEAHSVSVKFKGEEGAEVSEIPVLSRIVAALEAAETEIKEVAKAAASNKTATPAIPGATAEPKKYADDDVSPEAKLWRLQNSGK